MDALTPYLPCPICGSSRRRGLDRYSTPDWKLAACEDCGFVYLANPPPYEALEEDLAWEVSHKRRLERRGGSTPISGLNRRFRERFGLNRGRVRGKRFVDFFGPGRVLDIGCGGGNRLEPPITPYGIELSKALHAKADALMRSRGGHCLHGAGAETLDAFEDGFFDGVLMFSYLEHEVQVAKTLRGVHRVLKPGGRAYVRVPNFGSLNRRVLGARWCGFRWPDHVNYFTPGTLRAVAERFGFGLKLVNRATLPVDDNVSALLVRK